MSGNQETNKESAPKGENNISSQTQNNNVEKKVEPKPESKPFSQFINEDFIPKLKISIENFNKKLNKLELITGPRPIVEDNCWMVYGELEAGRRFWLCFSEESIMSNKTIIIAESKGNPSLIESFLIDEKKITLALLLSRLLQRLNGQKWLGAN